MVEASRASQNSTKGRCRTRDGGSGKDVNISALGPARAVVVEEGVEFGIRQYAGEAIELALAGDLARSLDKRIHGDPRERAADADAPHAHVCDVLDGEPAGTRHQQVDRQ